MAMPEAFDAYYKWLGIPRAEQPPHQYRLLSIDLFENDAEVIDGAADRQMAHIRTFQSGPHSAESQKLLNELSAARICLLNAEKKSAYDAELRWKLDPPRATRLPPVAPQGAPLPIAQPQLAPLPIPKAKPISLGGIAPIINSEPAVKITPRRGPAGGPHRRHPPWQAPVAVVALVLTLFAVAYALLGGGGKAPPVSTADRPAKENNPKTDKEGARKGTGKNLNGSKTVLPNPTEYDKSTATPGVRPGTGADDGSTDETIDGKLARTPSTPESAAGRLAAPAKEPIELHDEIEIKKLAPVDRDSRPEEPSKKVADAKPAAASTASPNPVSITSSKKVADAKPAGAPGQSEHKLTAQEAFTLKDHVGAVTRVAFHPNPSLPLLASAGKDGRVLLWNLDQKIVQGELAKFREEVWAVKFSTNGELLTYANRNWWGSVVSFKTVAAGQEIKALKNFKNGGGAVVSVAYSPDDRFFAASQDDGTIRLWDTTSFQESAPLSLGSNVFSLAFGPITIDRKHKRSDYLLAAGCKDGSIKLLAVTLAKEKGNIRGTFEPTSVQFPPGDPVSGVRFSPDGKFLATTRYRGLISLYDPRTGVSVRQMQAGGGNADWISFHPQQPWCVTAHWNDRLARIWNTETGELLCALPGHTGGVLCAEFSRDGRRVATASDDFSIKLWDLTGAGVPAAPKRSKKAKAPVPIVGY